MLRALAKTCPCLGHVVAGGGCLELFARWRRAKSPQCWFWNSSVNPAYVGSKTWVYTWSPIVPESEGVVRVVWSFNGRILIGFTTFDRLQVPSSGRRRREIPQTSPNYGPHPEHVSVHKTLPNILGPWIKWLTFNAGNLQPGLYQLLGDSPSALALAKGTWACFLRRILPWGFTIGDVETLAGLFSLILVAKSPPLLIFMVKLPHVC